WQQCQAEQWQEAYDLLRKEWIFSHLNLWGNNAILLELYELLLPSGKWQPEDMQAALIYNNLGLALRDLGQIRQAQEYFEQALNIVREEENSRMKGTTFNNLGKVYAGLGETEPAKEYLEQSLRIRREIGYRGGEGKTLRNLGEVYQTIGQIELAQK